MIRQHKFTLVELLAAMAVFAVLLLISMRLFSGTQRMWVRSEQKTNAFADTRSAMEFVAARLQTMIYYSVDDERVPFQLTVKKAQGEYFDKDTSSIYFMTSMPMNRKTSNDAGGTGGDRNSKQNTKNLDNFDGFRFLRFRVKDGKLKMDIASARNSRKFQYLVPPYGVYYKKTPKEDAIFSSAYWKKDDTLSTVTIMKNVTDFKFTPYVINNSGNLEKDDSDQEEPPELLEIEISVIDNDDKFNDYNDADSAEKDAIKSEYGYTFRRAVQLGK